MNVALVSTTEEHIVELGQTMRLADVIEVGLAREGSPYEVLSVSVGCTQNPMTAVDDDGRVVAILGCSFGAGYAFPWMLSSALVRQHKKAAISLAQMMVEEWMEEAREKGIPMLCNYINRDNHSARRYVQGLGFTIFNSPGPGPFDFFFQLVTPCAPSSLPS